MKGRSNPPVLIVGLLIATLSLYGCGGEPLAWRLMPISRIGHAVLGGDALTVLAELGRGENPNQRIGGKSLLRIAAEKNYYDVARVLAQTLGTNLNDADENGITPLYSSVFNCNSGISHVLLQFGANPNARVKTTAGGALRYGAFVTPLEGAVMCQKWELFYFLLTHGADPFDRNAFSVAIQGCSLPNYHPEYVLALMKLVDNPTGLANSLPWPSSIDGCKEKLRKALDTKWIPPTPTEAHEGLFLPVPALIERLQKN